MQKQFFQHFRKSNNAFSFHSINLKTSKKEGKSLHSVCFFLPFHSFQIDEDSGVVTVAQCSGTPGEFPCIDFERKQKYTLTVSATDMKGAADGRTRSVTLIINIEDENDVKPAIEKSYERFIFENERVTINPLRIDVSAVARLA